MCLQVLWYTFFIKYTHVCVKAAQSLFSSFGNRNSQVEKEETLNGRDFRRESRFSCMSVTQGEGVEEAEEGKHNGTTETTLAFLSSAMHIKK